jgi:two-component system chemotaxis response regulator CheB
MDKKKILVVDDSALMRRVLCDIIESDDRFEVAGKAVNGLEALDLVSKNKYDAVVLDVNMPKMNGLEFLREVQKAKIQLRVMMASTDTREGAQTTLDALDLGALDFIHKPDNAYQCKEGIFPKDFLRILSGVVASSYPVFRSQEKIEEEKNKTKKVLEIIKKTADRVPGNKIVAIASSTGGPKALQSVIPRLPGNLDAPVLLVQHMPVGFTASLAERLDSLSEIHVVEAKEGDVIEKGTVYIAPGGKHMNLVTGAAGKYSIHLSDEPSREGVKPCANYMYESLRGSKFDSIICVVMTGMGADGTEGIKNLKAVKKIHVISQTKESCTIYGMPKSVDVAGLSDQHTPLDELAQEIIMKVGITK